MGSTHAECREAGIRVARITGDHVVAASAIRIVRTALTAVVGVEIDKAIRRRKKKA